jgi:diguanylate cyclase (GGDEF)-like protein
MLALDTDSGHRYSPSAPTPLLAGASLPPCRVMVVDDDEWMRVYLAAILKSASYEVDVADSGKEALQHMRHGVYDILLTDCMMPEMDGLTLCQRVRTEFADNSPYILMFTVRDAREDRYAGLKSGADEYILKRTPRSELLAKVNVGRRIQNGLRAIASNDTAGQSRQSFDPLTGAHDLDHFSQQMPQEIRGARQGSRALSVLSCRILGLENITRQYGYASADEIRRAFVASVRSHLRNGPEWIARVGEDRFITVLPCTRFKAAERLARKLHRRFAGLPVTTTAGSIRCSVQIDVTACEPKADHAASRAGGLTRPLFPATRANPSRCSG